MASSSLIQNLSVLGARTVHTGPSLLSEELLSLNYPSDSPPRLTYPLTSEHKDQNGSLASPEGLRSWGIGTSTYLASSDQNGLLASPEELRSG
eukprot:9535487-Alexandrium_andersonii.AAC.1